ncbi:DUF418 domain-containing protein [Paenisporosarcina antarctica]|uniref:DUF418 domain-containing protein n=1 Tax=Paenisporosarcina antarctica TaxID=417367 RepID=A0A4P7A033_9BACL|nr:DUF418 domain-containing protein [Paenisporosarcina antarctica]QBP41729.1 DUF418 domain-containing protein [Paenisporosarcina antarctica]
MKVRPTELQERVIAIDMMRGFSLLGIFIVNMLAFHTPYYYINPYTWYTDPSDIDTFQWIDIALQGSVYPLFAMLFGYGLTMQFIKSQERGMSFIALGIRRLSVLFIIGIIHAFLLWSGDILITYALSGFIVIFLLRLSRVWLLVIALTLYAIPNMGLALLTYIYVASDGVFYSGIQEMEASVVAFSTGSWTDIFAQRAADWSYANIESGALFLIGITILPYMLLGVVAAKSKLIERTSDKLPFWFVLTLVTLVVGYAIKVLPFFIEPNFYYMYVQDIFGGPLVAIGYAGLITMLCQLSMFRKLFNPIAKVGRMSMTTYLTQSLIATTIFYSYGLGFYGKMDLVTGTWMAIGIFIIQLIFAEIWFSKFNQGPVEIIWKRATYGKKINKNDEKNDEVS